MKLQQLFFLAVAGSILATSSVYAQQGSAGSGPGGMGAMMGGPPEDVRMMMQEPNKAMAQASVVYMTVFTRSLHTQATERRDKIDSAFIKAAFAEMKRAYGMIESFQAVHVKTMDAAMQDKVKMMMTRMNTNLADIRKHLDVLEKEVNGKQNLDIISERTGIILKHLDDMPKPMPGGMGAPGGTPGMGMPGGRPMMQ